MGKKSDTVCVMISVLPVIVLLFFFNSLKDRLSTNMSGNGMLVSKDAFILVLLGLGMLWYYLSYFLSQRPVFLNFRIQPATIRRFINAFFSILSILLIITNMWGGWDKLSGINLYRESSKGIPLRYSLFAICSLFFRWIRSKFNTWKTFS